MTFSLDDLAGKTAIVTGAGQNIGRAIALAFAGLRMNVVVNGRSNSANVDEVVREARTCGGQAIGVMADVGKADEVKRLVDEATARFGQVDVVVNNVSRRLFQPFESITLDDWRSVLDSNLNAVFYMAHYALPGMRSRGWGRFISISGVDGFSGHVPNRAHNVTAKAGMQGLTKAIAREYGQFGITANTVVPGAINTVRDLSQYPTFDQKRYTENIPVGRFGEAEEIAQACVYLASPAGAFVNGQALHLNGGDYMG